MDISRLSRDYEKEPLLLGEKPSKEDLEYLYMELNWSREEVAKYIGKSEAQTKKYLAAHKFRKTQEQKAEIRKRTTLEKYGVENISQLESTKLKKEQRALERYGVKNVSQSKEIKDKIKCTLKENYGCENPMHSEEIKAKIKKTNLEKYGSEYVFSSKEIQDKIKQTNLEKYGFSSPLKNKLVLEKLKRTNLEKYGCENPMNLKEIQKKVKQANLEKYGSEHIFSLPDYKNKIKQTNLEKYGCENPMQNKEVQEKVKCTNLKKYNCLRANQTENFKENYWGPETFSIIRSPDTLRAYIEQQKVKTVLELSSNLNMSESAFRSYCHKYGLWNLIDHYTSSYELELQSLFPSMYKTRSVIHPYEIDLYSEEHKFGIEFNGNYWHSELKLPPDYHQKKSLFAEKHGIFLYHIWEYEWQDPVLREKIISQIKNLMGLNENKIYARKCKIEYVSSSEAREFLDENHIQGYCSDSIRFGLYYENELVSIMTFGKPRFKSECQYELIRFCNKKNTSVIGSASKLFKHFLKEYNPFSILSYSHIDKGRGSLYESLGFSLKKISSPDYVWYDGEEVLSRYQCQKHKLLKMGLEGNSEKEIMENLGFFKIHSCGNKVWEWKKVHITIKLFRRI